MVKEYLCFEIEYEIEGTERKLNKLAKEQNEQRNKH